MANHLYDYKIKTEEMFFQHHLPDELQMKSAFKNFNPGRFVAFILKNSCLKKTIYRKNRKRKTAASAI